MTDHEWRTAASEPVSRVTRSRQRPRTPARIAAGPGRTAAAGRRPETGEGARPGGGGVDRGGRHRDRRGASPPGINGPGLTSVGPVSATDGFPVWYKDKTGLRLENCISQADPLCPAFGALPDPTAPISFPDNYPDEGFYSLANANLNTGNNGKALLVLALEQAFRNGPVARRRPGHLRPAAAEDHQRHRTASTTSSPRRPASRPCRPPARRRAGLRHRGHRHRRPGRLQRRARRADRTVPDLGHLPDRPGAEAGRGRQGHLCRRRRDRAQDQGKPLRHQRLPHRGPGHQPEPDGRRLPHRHRPDRGLHRDRPVHRAGQAGDDQRRDRRAGHLLALRRRAAALSTSTPAPRPARRPSRSPTPPAARGVRSDRAESAATATSSPASATPAPSRRRRSRSQHRRRSGHHQAHQCRRQGDRHRELRHRQPSC